MTYFQSQIPHHWLLRSFDYKVFKTVDNYVGNFWLPTVHRLIRAGIITEEVRVDKQTAIDTELPLPGHVVAVSSYICLTSEQPVEIDITKDYRKSSESGVA